MGKKYNHLPIGHITKSGNIVVSYLDENRTNLKCVKCGNIFTLMNKTVRYKPCICPKCKTSGNLDKDRFVGQKIGRWTVKRCLHKRNNSNYMLYECICDCGTQRQVASNSLDGRSKSCGCLAAELTRARYINYPKKKRKTRNINNAVWRRLVKYIKIRDKNKCLLCDGIEKLTPHHLDGWNWCNQKRYDETNLILLCDFCHTDFHSKYCKGNNTKTQFLEYIKNYPINTEELFLKIENYKIKYNFVNTLTQEQLILMNNSIEAD